MLIIGALIFILTNSHFFETPKFLSANKTNNATDTKGGLQVIEISSRNVSEKSRSKRLDSEDDDISTSLSAPQMPDSQKLIFYPNRALKPPRTAQKMKAIHYNSLPPNHKISSRILDEYPRNHNHVTLMPRPHSYLQPPTGRTFYNHMQNHSPQRISFNHAPHLQPNTFKVHGTYRQGRRIPQNHQPEPSNVASNFISPYEINQMVNPVIDGKIVTTLQPQSEKNYFRRKFRQPIASIPNYDIHAQDAANIYGNILQSTPNATLHQVTERNGNPFSVMLDVMPMQGEESDYTSILHLQHPSKFRPMMNKFYQDPQYFNTMNFPQLMPRYPAPYFRYQPQPSNNMYGTIHTGNGMMKPSQIVVHLNLFPKNNLQSHKRSSSENDKHVQDTRLSKLNSKKNQTDATHPFNINFNINGHPENQAYRINQSSTETAMTQNYFYDDEDDFNADDHSMSVAPSLVYKNIYRDKPFHYEYLRNSTMQEIKPTVATTRNPTIIKTANMKHHYKIIERPRAEKNVRNQFGPFY